MASSARLAPVRHLAASGLMALASAGWILDALRAQHSYVDMRLPQFLVAAILAGGAAAMARRKSLVSQLLGQSAAFAVAAPTLLAVLSRVLGGHLPGIASVALAAATIGAIVLTRPTLHSTEAEATFAPIRYRRWFLAAATAAGSVGIGALAVAVLGFAAGATAAGFGFVLMGLAGLAAAIATVRMRGWGVLLGGASALGTLAVAATMHDMQAFALATTAIPGAMLAAPVIGTALGLLRAEPVRSRVADFGGQATTEAHVRVDVGEEAWEEIEPETRAARAHS